MEETNSNSVEFGMGESSVIGIETATNSVNAPKPLLGMKFNSHEEAYNYYNSYKLLMGFGIRKSSVNYSRKTREVVDRKFVCDKEGYKSNSGKIEIPLRRETRVGCKAMMRVKLLEDKSWEVTGFVEEHTNYVLSSPDKAKMHRSHQQFYKTERCKKLIDSLREEGMPPSTISRVINATNGRDGEFVTSQQCIDHIRTQRVNNIGHECISIIRHFQSMTANDPEFYFAIEVDSSGQMRSVFWADRRSRASYLQFSDVIVFDVTYRTNKFGLPFAPFTGVNHHTQSTLLGCALLADEQEDTFVWLFEEWLKCMHGIEPGAIITDQDRATCNAIHSVFPTTRHRYCYWHMQKHIIDHLPTLVSRYGEQFQRYWGLWCNSSSIEQCEGYWVEMKEKFDINEEGEGWLQTIYKCREHWVSCYLKDTFFAGMRSSQRSESINAFFDGYVNSQTQLHEFVTQYEKAVTHRRLSEAHEDFKSLNTKPVMLLGHPIEVQAGEMYTRNMFDVFHTEFKGFGTEFCEELRKDGDIVEYKVCKFTDRGKWEVVTYEQSSQMQFCCTCALFETNGVVCRHILSLMMARQMDSLPDHYILHRWTIHARHRNIGVGNIVFGRNITSCEEKINLLKSWALRAKFNNVLELAFDSEEKLQQLDDVLTNFMESLEEEVGETQDQIMDIPQPSAPISHTIENIPQITVRDPDRPARTKGRPRNATRIQSGLEQAQEKKERKKHICSRCVLVVTFIYAVLVVTFIYADVNIHIYKPSMSIYAAGAECI
ncbi:protein FAR1-RELATED SEQUENCE 5-like [Asparagus officinalis]|uniref:protein FAR1-RELATED SEQUENCE 5-like n=1 Tax=Asparagus officinalis TaxID=4686 RepID=UPI00098E8608|nr:protein FAR1-RELATED SEQUENCE 5-like [Asparagus officinalis]